MAFLALWQHINYSDLEVSLKCKFGEGFNVAYDLFVEKISLLYFICSVHSAFSEFLEDVR